MDTLKNIKENQRILNLFKNSIDAKTAIVSILENTGIAGFKFNVPKSERIKLENYITDYYTDSNSSVQDHIALKPITITLNGLHGEYFYSVNQIEDMLAKVKPTLELVEQFKPKLDAATKQIQRKKTEQTYKYNAETNKIEAAISLKEHTLNSVDLFKKFQEIYKLKSSQTRAYFFFEAMRNSREIFSVEASYKRFDNMAIQSLIAMRDNNADITDFTITFKQIDFTQSSKEKAEDYVARTKQEISKIVNKGVDKGEKVDP